MVLTITAPVARHRIKVPIAPEDPPVPPPPPPPIPPPGPPESGAGLYAWGRNSDGVGDGGQLGLGDLDDRSSPVQVGADIDWGAVSAGAVFSTAIKTDGTLWSWGRNDHGQLGMGDTVSRSSPVQVGGDTDWSSVVATGTQHVLAVKTDGTLWAWGDNQSAALGVGDDVDRSSPVQVGSDTNWVLAAAGDACSYAVKADGTLWAWGGNDNGRLGLGDTSTRNSPTQVGGGTDWSTSILTGQGHVIAVKSDGTLWAWGWNFNGQLGIGDSTDRSSPVQVGSSDEWGSLQFTMSEQASAAITQDGALWAWGDNGQGQLGLGDTTDRSSPVQVGASDGWLRIAPGGRMATAIRDDGTLWTWGDNFGGQLGHGDTVDRSSPVQVGSDSDWVVAGTSSDATTAFVLAIRGGS